MRLRFSNALMAIGTACVWMCSTDCRAAATLSVSAHSELIFVAVTEIPHQGPPAGRAGLKFVTNVGGWGYNGTDSEDGMSDSNVDLGYIGGFPDGKAPLPGSGAYITFNPFISGATDGETYGIGTLIFQFLMTDKTQGKSRWELTCEIRTWVEVTGAFDTLLQQGYWSANAGFDATDSLRTYSETLAALQGQGAATTKHLEGLPRTIHLVIDGSPDADPAFAEVNLRAEAECDLHIGPFDGSFSTPLFGVVTDEWPTK